MKNKMLIVPIIIMVMSSCYREDTITGSGSATKAIFQHEADKGDTVRDMNIYVFDIQTGMNIAHMFTTAENTIELPYGDYEIYVLANTGKDLGENKTLSEVKSMRFTAVGLDESAIPMYGNETVQIFGTTTIPVLLTRCPAKVDIDIEVDNSLKNMTIQSIQLKNVASTGLYFPTGKPATETCDLEIEYTGENEKKGLSRSWLLAENCCGTVPTISSQREKNQKNAPEGATYLLINALCENRFCTYRVFLGENNTTDFNLRRNSTHRMHITIRGENEIDTRMENEMIEIRDNMEHPEFPGASIPGDYNLTFLPLEDNNDSYSAKVNLISGDQSNFFVEGAATPHTISLGNLSSVQNIPISYHPGIINSQNSALVYEVTIKSGKGNEYTKRFEHTFCNELFVYTSYPELGFPEGGDVEPAGHFIKKIGCNSHRAVRILVPSDNEYLKAICEDGFALEGWYRGLGGGIITQNENYTHRLTCSNDTLAMKFKREKFFIYTDISQVEVLCFRKDPVVVSEKSAYAVDPGSWCSIRPKDQSLRIAGWYDDPVLRTEDHLVSIAPIYEFVPTENVRLYPEYR